MSILKENISVGLCSDHAGYEMKSVVEGYLDSMGVKWHDYGTHSTDSCDYPDYAHPCAAALKMAQCTRLSRFVAAETAYL